MSVDTRTPRTPTGGRSPGFDDEPVLSSVKVPCDPAQVIVNHASFRVQLAAPVSAGAARGATAGAASGPGTAAAGATASGPARRRAPVVWSGRTTPGDTTAPTTQLLHAVRNNAGRSDDAGATQVLPRVRPEETTSFAPPPSAGVIGPRGASDDTELLPQVPQARPSDAGWSDDTYAHAGAYTGSYTDSYADSYADSSDGSYAGPYDGSREGAASGPYDGAATGPDGGSRGAWGEAPYGHEGPYGGEGPYSDAEFEPRQDGGRRFAGDKQAFYPDRRMNLGVVLLPLRIFLGFITIYAGMGKLCDPVYFDGGERGSMVKWLESLDPWALATPLRDFALAHPVGAGLTVAFLQVVVGVLTVCGLWQRVAASLGALLSAALLMTVSWRNVPVYDAPDIIYLAAWSPLIIAGAPVYSLDARLAGEAWRNLGPRVEVWDLRRRVLRRGAVMTAVVAGLTLLIGSLLGGAVRSASGPTVPKPGEPPTNSLPGRPLHTPREAPGRTDSGRTAGASQGSSASPTAGASRGTDSSASPQPSQPSTARETAGATQGVQPGRTTSGPPQQSTPADPPAATQAPTSTAGTGGGTTGGSSGGSSSGGSSGGSSSGGTLGGLLG
ncbi:DoxX family membrane protein [Streptomyces sp. NPDC053542]|uniref:DoxX family protein n=1 Tax=Streptomyces sp. NPDC053542 TaxID=3365710 RepID=UPI0037D1A24B